MREEDMLLIERIKEIDDFIALCESLDKEEIVYNELELAKQYEMIHSPFAELEPEL